MEAIGNAIHSGRGRAGRGESRHERRVAVSVLGALGGTPVRVRNVSRSGAQIGCPEPLYPFLQPALSADTGTLELDLGAGEQVAVSCRPVYARPCGDETLVGLRFVDDDEPGRQIISLWLLERLQSA